jgi:hypothetical protein
MPIDPAALVEGRALWLVSPSQVSTGPPFQKSISILQTFFSVLVFPIFDSAIFEISIFRFSEDFAAAWSSCDPPRRPAGHGHKSRRASGGFWELETSKAPALPLRCLWIRLCLRLWILYPYPVSIGAERIRPTFQSGKISARANSDRDWLPFWFVLFVVSSVRWPAGPVPVV